MTNNNYSVIESVIRCLEEKPGILSLVMALFFSLSCIVYWSFTITTSICSGAGDCVKYSEMARSFTVGEYGSIDYPFNLRVMAPWFSSILSQDTTKGFVWLNGISALLFVIFWFEIALKLSLRNAEFAVLVFWFFLHPLGFRFYFAAPASVDPLSYAFLGLISFLFISEKRVALWIVILFALFAKESFSFIALIIAAAELVYVISTRDKRAGAAMGSIFGAILVLFIYKITKDFIQIHLFSQSQEWEITTFSTISWWVNEVWNDPKRLIVWIGSFMCATGVFSVFLIGKTSLTQDPLKTRQAVYLMLGSAGFTVLGILAGSDMSRIIFNGNLFIISALLLSFRNQRLPISQLFITFISSAAIALNYTTFFPSAFEYDYYTQGHRIGPTVYYILVTISITFILHLFFHKFPDNIKCCS